MSALNTDLYELTMAAGYFAAGKTEEVATFELSIRRLPPYRNFLVAAGLQQAVEFLLSLQFRPDEIDYLRSLSQLKNTPPEFFQFLGNLRFTGDLFAVPEGTPIFPSEPIALVRAPLVEAQLVETYLLSTFAFQTMLASKAARCVFAAAGRPVVEFGSRRAHSPGAGILAGRAAYIAGCAGTSNAQSGMQFGIPVFGTAAHSWTMAFDKEAESFRLLQQLLGDDTVFLVDTYDTLKGTRITADLGAPLWGVRLDSGDLGPLSRQVRQILDGAGLTEAKIFATNDLDEHRIAELIRDGACIDAFGVRTSADSPTLSAVYKLVELRHNSQVHYAAKFSDEKHTLPAAKQIYRYPDHDFLAMQTDRNTVGNGEPLLRPVIVKGQLVEPSPATDRIRSYADQAVRALPPSLRSLKESSAYPVVVSPSLLELAGNLRAQYLNR